MFTAYNINAIGFAMNNTRNVDLNANNKSILKHLDPGSRVFHFHFDVLSCRGFELLSSWLWVRRCTKKLASRLGLSGSRAGFSTEHPTVPIYWCTDCEKQLWPLQQCCVVCWGDRISVVAGCRICVAGVSQLNRQTCQTKNITPGLPMWKNLNF